MSGQKDRGENRLASQAKDHRKRFASRKIRSIEELETLAVATYQGHHTTDRLDKRGAKTVTIRPSKDGVETTIFSKNHTGTVSKSTFRALLTSNSNSNSGVFGCPFSNEP